uniref:Uncharacterized protein n=1 Tax=Arundo donax TaxID=35708 RepID=A0A0A8Z0H1_ARUDO
MITCKLNSKQQEQKFPSFTLSVFLMVTPES